MKETKIQKQYIDYSCGFAVTLHHVPLIKIDGEWIADLDYDQVAKAVLQLLAFKPLSFTGNELAFIRIYFRMTYREFAKRFGITHPTIVKWEKRQDRLASITWCIEKDIRLFILDKLCRKSTAFRQAYRQLEDIHLKFDRKKKPKPITLDLKKNDLKIAC